MMIHASIGVKKNTAKSKYLLNDSDIFLPISPSLSFTVTVAAPFSPSKKESPK